MNAASQRVRLSQPMTTPKPMHVAVLNGSVIDHEEPARLLKIVRMKAVIIMTSRGRAATCRVPSGSVMKKRMLGTRMSPVRSN